MTSSTWYNFCACGRKKVHAERVCFRCEEKIDVFVELDGLIARGVGCAASKGADFVAGTFGYVKSRCPKERKH